MNMNRRSFLAALFCSPLTALLPASNPLLTGQSREARRNRLKLMQKINVNGVQDWQAAAWKIECEMHRRGWQGR